MLQDAVKKARRPARRRRLVDEVRAAWKVSIRRTCSVLQVDRSHSTYRSRRGDQAALEQRIKEITGTRVRGACPGLDPGAIAVSMSCCGGGLDRESEVNLPPLQGDGPSAQEQGPEATDEGAVTGRPNGGDSFQPDLGDGFRSRPARNGPQTAHPDGHRRLLALLAGGRSAVQLPRRGRRTGTRAEVLLSRLSQGDPGRPGLGVHPPRRRPVRMKHST